MPEAPPSLRVFHLQPDRLVELARPPAEMPAKGFIWIGVARAPGVRGRGTAHDRA